MQKLVIATSNSGKIKEIQHFLKEFPVKIYSQADFKINPIVETGQTFIENAILKARHACLESHLPTLADDSGLVIDALNGAPGIHSARYAGEPANDVANIEKVLQEMRGIPIAQRTAHFYCSMVLMRSANDPAPILSVGVWHGSILTKTQGHFGFGYDPCFYVPSHQCSAAELDLSIKNTISHRGLALQNLKVQLDEHFR